MSNIKQELKRLKKLSPEAAHIVQEALKECRQREEAAEYERSKLRKEAATVRSHEHKSEDLIRHQATRPLQRRIKELNDELEQAKKEQSELKSALTKADKTVPEEPFDPVLEPFRKAKLDKHGIGPGHHQLVFKCFSCGLHYMVLTWYPSEHPAPACPECGERESFPLAAHHVEKEIYQFCTLPWNGHEVVLMQIPNQKG